MAPCCARDIEDMRKNADLTRRLKSVDITTKAVEARMLNPGKALWKKRFMCGDTKCDDAACSHEEIFCEEADGSESNSDDEFDLDEENDPYMQRIRAERLAAMRYQENCKVQMVQQGNGRVQDCPIEGLGEMVKKAQLLVVHLAVPKNAIGGFTTSHLQKIATKSLGTSFVQCDISTEEEAKNAASDFQVERLPSLLCFRDGKVMASEVLESFEELDESDFELTRWLRHAGMMTLATGARDSDDDDEEELPPCGVRGCKQMYNHEHVGKGSGTGGVERFEDLVEGGSGRGVYSERLGADDRYASSDEEGY